RVQRVDWDYSPGLFKSKDDNGTTYSADKQFENDAVIWYHTLFKQRESSQDPASRRVLAQQRVLRRHFVAMALFGVQARNQHTGNYQNIEESYSNVPLAALPSHGGRFAYESDESDTSRDDQNVIEKLRTLLLSGRAEGDVMENKRFG